MAHLFKTTKYPALAFYADDQRFKFRGGELVVEDEHADAVASFVRSHKEYGITLENANYTPPVEVTVGIDDAAQSQAKLDALNKPAPVAPETPVDPAPDAQGDTETGDKDAGDANDDGANDDAPAGEEDADEAFDAAAEREAFEAMKNDDLRKLLEADGANVSGNHKELVARAVEVAAEKRAAAKAPDAE